MADAWESLSAIYTLSNARVVATLKDGGAVVETALELEVMEGRRKSWSGNIDGDLCELEYLWNFEQVGAPVPEAGEWVQARIVIEGEHENGRRLEVRGDGWIGFDDNSLLAGHFIRPPRMLLDHDAELAADEESEAGDREPSPPVHDFIPKDPKPSPQFGRALYGRLAEEHHGLPTD